MVEYVIWCVGSQSGDIPQTKPGEQRLGVSIRFLHMKDATSRHRRSDRSSSAQNREKYHTEYVTSGETLRGYGQRSTDLQPGIPS